MYNKEHNATRVSMTNKQKAKTKCKYTQPLYTQPNVNTCNVRYMIKPNAKNTQSKCNIMKKRA